MMIERKCIVCRNVFKVKSTNNKSKTCSKSCARIYLNVFRHIYKTLKHRLEKKLLGGKK
jgi:endogenous inhibitor of DNA gyrase (YacG/DUF329 family)